MSSGKVLGTFHLADVLADELPGLDSDRCTQLIDASSAKGRVDTTAEVTTDEVKVAAGRPREAHPACAVIADLAGRRGSANIMEVMNGNL